MSTKNRTRRTTTRNIRFPNQMIEQINIALEQKVREFLSLGHWKYRQTNVRKREHIHQLKVMKNRHPRSSLRTGRYCKIHLITKALQ